MEATLHPLVAQGYKAVLDPFHRVLIPSQHLQVISLQSLNLPHLLPVLYHLLRRRRKREKVMAHLVPVGEMETRRSQLRGEQVRRRSQRRKWQRIRRSRRKPGRKVRCHLVVVCVSVIVVSYTESTSIPPKVVQSGTPPHPHHGHQGPHHMAKQQQAAYRSVYQATCGLNSAPPPPATGTTNTSR